MLHLTEEVEAIALKFFHGNNKHGGNLFRRDLSREATDENRDQGVYLKAEKYKHIFADAMDQWLEKQKDITSTTKLL